MVTGEVEESGGLNPHVKEGIYIGRLAGVRERVLDVPVLDANNKPTGEKQKRESWEWVFGVRTGDGDLRMTAITSRKFGTKTKAFTFAKGLNGGKLEVGDKVDTDELVGSYANLTLKDKQRTDRLGNVITTSIITDVLALESDPEKEIEIEGLAEEEDSNAEPEPGEVTPPAAAPPVVQPPKPGTDKKKPKK